MTSKIKNIADQIFKLAAPPQKHVVTLQIDKGSISELEKIFGSITGFSDITANKIQIEVPISLNLDNTDIVDFEQQLNDVLKRKPLTNVRFTVIRSIGRPTRIVRPR